LPRLHFLVHEAAFPSAWRPAKRRELEDDDIVSKYPSAEDDAEFARIAPSPASVARWEPFNDTKKNTPYLMVTRNLNWSFPSRLQPFSFHYDSTERDAQSCASVRGISAALSKIYNSKEKRLAAIEEFLSLLLGRLSTVIEVPEGKANGVVRETWAFREVLRSQK